MDLTDFDDGVVIGPGPFEAVSEEFNGRGSVGIPDQKTSGRCAKSTHHPKNIFHCVAPFLL
jgi:hypothetical protein